MRSPMWGVEHSSLHPQVLPTKELVAETWNVASTWLDDTMTAVIPVTAGFDDANVGRVVL